MIFGCFRVFSPQNDGFVKVTGMCNLTNTNVLFYYLGAAQIE